MEHYEKSIIPLIESVYANLTPLEKTIADFFIHNREEMDFSSRNISQLLYVSEASLSRFSKKCGFKGYREFLFHYRQTFSSSDEPAADDQTKLVLNTYQELLNKTYSLVDIPQMERILKILTTKKRIYVYGRGSSGLAADEMRFRFMRIGLNIVSITDHDMMRMNTVVISNDCAVIGISVSGQTEAVINSLRESKKQGAATILMTSCKEREFQKFCDEVLLFAVKEHLENGKAISPQFPILVMLDLLYSRFLQSDKFRREALHEYTLNVITPVPKDKNGLR